MFWYDGKLTKEDTISLNITDPGLIYGATVFTTLRVYQNSLDHPLTQWEAHCRRLQHSLKTFNWNLPHWPRVRQGAEALIASYPVLRITIFPDGREWITGRFLPENLAQSQQQGIQGWVAHDVLFQRTLASHKTGNYLGAFLALQTAKSLGYREAILVNHQGNWLETSTGNLWGWKAEKWWTPPLETSILPGIGRSQLLYWLTDQNISVEQTLWTPNFVESLKVIAYSNSVLEIIPFSSIDAGEKRFEFNPFHLALKQLFSYYHQL
ncbi:aminotransferase class IV [Aphanothece sacrum]|uniref:BcaT protein n=1 Tax=Aphanothece sacrum FPU1 TaxID=1920663 RepID=A0A401IL35_APHSA|nr:aminotransferase class IV [Aphanothece sacrum]GBF81964.1 BcaT protein [Aphanothece sacrum FPU1]GBF83593.1 BcaT protein [Aphanothece sacrum FPU3]